MDKIAKVMIGVPSQNSWHPDFGLSLFNAGVSLMQSGIKGYDGTKLRMFNKRGSILPQLREGIFIHAVQQSVDYLLMVDADQTFPANTIQRLAFHGKPVVAANVVTKMLPASPTARKKSYKDPIKGEKVYTDPDSTGLEQVWRVGTGVMLIHIPSVKNIEAPRFNLEWRVDDDFIGEDWYFCAKLEKAGIPIFIDHDLSKLVGHIGNFTYTHDYVGELK